MPAYQGPANSTVWTGPYIPPTQVLPVDDLPYTLFNNETQAAGVASIAVYLGKKDDSHPGSVSVELFFSGAPGTFEVDLQTADTDADGLYQQEGNGINAVNANNAARGEYLQITANFARLFIKTLTNNVKITARITRR